MNCFNKIVFFFVISVSLNRNKVRFLDKSFCEYFLLNSISRSYFNL